MSEQHLTDLLGLRGKPALVVGGGYGIGRESALILAQAGADVAVADLDLERAEGVQAEIEALGVRSAAFSGDVTKSAECEAIVNGAAEALGGLEVLINMVGTAGWCPVVDMTDDDWELDLRRNLTQHFYVSRAAGRIMIEQGRGGRIAVVASVSGLYGAPNHASYGAAKAGLMDLVRTMAHEWGQYGIRINGVAPDMINTPRMAATHAAQGMDPDANAKADGAPLGRAGLADEIAKPLVFLVSDLASFMSGQTLVVDGGMRAAFPHWRATEQMR
jgi:2-deoxy-D-gluconate 3-dehydrogenase